MTGCNLVPQGMVFDSPARLCAGVAQLDEHLFRTQADVGSTPTVSSENRTEGQTDE